MKSLCKRVYLAYEARKLKRFLLHKGMEKLASEGTNIQMEGHPTLFIQDEDSLNRVSLKASKDDGNKVDTSSILLTAADDYLHEFRRYVACCKLLRKDRLHDARTNGEE